MRLSLRSCPKGESARSATSPAGNSLTGLADPATAGAGAFGGVISTPFVFVWLNITVSLLCGCVLGLLSVRLTALVTPSSDAAHPETATVNAQATAA